MTIQSRKRRDGRTVHRAIVKISGKQITGENGWCDKRTAERDERRLHDRRAAGELQPSDGASLGAYLDRYLDSLLEVASTGRPLAATTAAKYRDQTRRIVGVIGDVPLARVTSADVERLRKALGRTLSPNTIGETLAYLGRALARPEARRTMLVGVNPAAASEVYRPKEKVAEAPAWLGEYAPEILEAVVGHRHLDAAVHLAIGAGLRESEVLGLKWSAIDLEAGTLEIREVKTRAGWKSEPKTDAGYRTIYLPAQVLEALRRQQAAQLERLGGVAEVVIDNGGRSWRPDSFSRSWRQFAERHPEIGGVHNLGTVTFHDLRHGGAQLMVAAGIPEAVALRIGGWSRREMLAYYAPGNSERANRDAADAIDRLLTR